MRRAGGSRGRSRCCAARPWKCRRASTTIFRCDDAAGEQARRCRGSDAMKTAPLMTRLLCVALVASIMMPLGREVYPYIASLMDSLKFDAIEAVLSATIGYAIYAAMFG